MLKNFLTISNLQLISSAGILHGTAAIWFEQLDSSTSSNNEKIFHALLLRFKPLALDWTREASFLSIRQMPQENPKSLPTECWKRVQKGKSDKDFMNLDTHPSANAAHCS